MIALLLLAALPLVGQDADMEQGLLPSHRIVTYYGNPLSHYMGILGALPPDEMLRKLSETADLWQKADPKTKVIPALELVATVAASKPGADGMYRSRMDNELIERVCMWARKRHFIVILDVQVGRSSVLKEITRLEPFLRRADVHLALDPEFQMRHGLKPGQLIGSSDAEDVNVAVDFLSRLIVEKKLPPKLLIVHRFTLNMLTHLPRIRPDPNVQVVVSMDGFGAPSFKRWVYRVTITRHPTKFVGIKLFYKNDVPMMPPADVLKLTPIPNVIIYQ